MSGYPAGRHCGIATRSHIESYDDVTGLLRTDVLVLGRHLQGRIVPDPLRRHGPRGIELETS